MARNYTRRKLLAGASAAGLAGLAGCAGSTPFVGQRIEDSERIALESESAVDIDGDAGDITVVGENRDDIDVDIVKQSSSIRTNLENLRFQVEQTDDTVQMATVWDGTDGWFTNRPSTNLDIAMPQTVALERIDASVGAITVRDVVGDPTIRASTGRVDVRSVAGTVDAETSTGRISIRDIDRLGDVRASTGRVEADVPDIDGDTRVTTSTGRVTLALSPDLDAEIHARSNTGSIDVDDIDLADATRGDDVVSGTLGDGGPTLSVETSTGRITLTTLD